MLRKIINIDEQKCNGCGLCARACHEGAIEIINGKAKLTRENFCDGFGDCLPECPTGAISFEEREAPAYDKDAVEKAKSAKNLLDSMQNTQLRKGAFSLDNSNSKLRQWPVQIKLVPIKADFFDNADVLIAADCTAYSYANFHNEFMDGKITLIACPKLDNLDYSEKLSQIFMNNNIKSVTLVRMEVPCCGGLQRMLQIALEMSGKNIPFEIKVISRDGRIL